MHLMLERTLGMERSKIRVIKPHVGGGFGCRTETLDIELIAGLLARAAKTSVRIVASREETFITHRGRPETQSTLKVGMRKDGKITAVEFETVQRGGAYSGYGIVTVNTMEQAKARAETHRGDKGGDAAHACLAMVALQRRWRNA